MSRLCATVVRLESVMRSVAVTGPGLVILAGACAAVCSTLDGAVGERRRQGRADLPAHRTRGGQGDHDAIVARLSARDRRERAVRRGAGSDGPVARKIVRNLETSKAQTGIHPLIWASTAERVTGIEPALSAWEAEVLPLNYTRVR